MIKWEYVIVELRGYEYEKIRQLNAFGSDGWELVEKQGNKCTFKRPYNIDEIQ